MVPALQALLPWLLHWDDIGLSPKDFIEFMNGAEDSGA
jgi:hypothetical protein